MTHAAILQIFWSYAIALWNLSRSWLIIFHFVVALKSNVVPLVIRQFCGTFMVPFTFIVLKRVDYSAKMWLLQKKESLTGLKWYSMMFILQNVHFWVNYIYIYLKWASTFFILHLCGKVFSFTQKRISRAPSLTWEFVESLFRTADIIATTPKISALCFCVAVVLTGKNGIACPEMLCLIRAAYYPGRESISFTAPRCVSWMWHKHPALRMLWQPLYLTGFCQSQ